MHGRLALQNSYTTGALSHARRGATADASTGKSDRPEAFAIRLLLLTGARKNEILKALWKMFVWTCGCSLCRCPSPANLAIFSCPTTPWKFFASCPTVPAIRGCFRGMRRESPSAIFIFSRTGSGGNWDLLMCVFTIYGILSLVFS